jgi:hypothetical protein
LHLASGGYLPGVVDASLRPAITEAAGDVREAARAARTDAVTARWRSQARRLQQRDTQVQLAWTMMQVIRSHEGDRGHFSPLPTSVVRSLDDKRP